MKRKVRISNFLFKRNSTQVIFVTIIDFNCPNNEWYIKGFLMASLEKIFKEINSMRHNTSLVKNPVLLLILKRQDSIFSSSNKSKGMEEFYICISIIEPINSTLEVPNIFFYF